MAKNQIDLIREKKNNSPKERIIHTLPLEMISPHPIAHNDFDTRDHEYLNDFGSMGQLEPITVKQDGNGNYLVVDGIFRFFVAKEIGLEGLKSEIIDIDESMILPFRYLKNFHTTKPLVKKLEVIDKIFGEFGRTQGKKIDLKKWETMIGYTIENQNKTRFELVIDLLKLDFSESTLRKLFNLYLFQKNGDEVVHELQLLKRIDDKSLSIDQADQLRKSYV